MSNSPTILNASDPPSSSPDTSSTPRSALPNPPSPLHQDASPCIIESDLSTPAPFDSPPQPLSSKQLTAITLFLAGQPDAKVAHALQVHRTTVTRWRLHNPLVVAELNRRRNALLSSTLNRFHVLTVKALKEIEAQLQDRKTSFCSDNRFRAASLLLRLSLRHPHPLAPTDPEKILADLLAQSQQIDDENDPLPAPQSGPPASAGG